MSLNLEEKLLADNEYDLHANTIQTTFEELITDNAESNKEMLSRIGLHDIVENINQADTREKMKQKYGKRLFHKTQIRNIAIKYRLRFLSVSQYKGSVDPKLIDNLKSFEEQFKTKVRSENCFILAPASEFNLKQRPVPVSKDPLFFVFVGSDNYYLVRKWGKDLSVFRQRVFYPIQNHKTYWNTIGWPVVLISLLTVYFLPVNIFSSLLVFIPLLILDIFVNAFGSEYVWDSKFK